MAQNLRPIVGEILKITYVSQLFNQVGLNVRHWIVSATVGAGAQLTTIAEAASNVISEEMKQLLTSEAQYRGVTIASIWPLPVGQTLTSNVGAGDGTGGATPTPQQVSGVLTLRSVQGGRSGRGRMYIPFPAASDVSTDLTPTAAYVTKLAALGTVMNAPLEVQEGANVTTLQPVIFRRAQPGNPAFIVNYRANDRWGTQRRRGNYGAPNVPPV